jgi:O-methyltransferase involved in polyketide biosynthesis
MARTHDDSWDLASSVGATATMIAAGRAMATKTEHPLINDPFADPLVRAVGLDFFVKMIDGSVDFSTVEDASPARMQAIINGVAVRTQYFDDYLLAAVDAGMRQVVILASGLDSRAYRLQWPADTVVYEIDQPQVIEFKTTTLAGLGAQPTATRRTVPIDLRADWPAALQASRPGRSSTDGVAGRRSADLPTVRSPGPVVRQHHRYQRAGQHHRHRIRSRPEGFGRGPCSRNVRAVSRARCRH